MLEPKATARKFGSSLDWLSNASMIYYSYNVRTPDFPLTAYVIEDQFRIYLSDIGLLTCMYGYETKAAVLSDTLTGPAKGALYESLTADLLAKNECPLYYYKKPNSTLEIEFLLEENASVVPVEVKAKKGTPRSLNELLKSDSIKKGYKFAGNNAGRADKKITLPLFMLPFLMSTGG